MVKSSLQILKMSLQLIHFNLILTSKILTFNFCITGYKSLSTNKMPPTQMMPRNTWINNTIDLNVKSIEKTHLFHKLSLR